MRLELVFHLIEAIPLQGSCAKPGLAFGEPARSRELRDLVIWRNHPVRKDLEAATVDHQGARGSDELKAASRSDGATCNFPA